MPNGQGWRADLARGADLAWGKDAAPAWALVQAGDPVQDGAVTVVDLAGVLVQAGVADLVEDSGRDRTSTWDRDRTFRPALRRRTPSLLTGRAQARNRPGVGACV